MAEIQKENLGGLPASPEESMERAPLTQPNPSSRLTMSQKVRKVLIIRTKKVTRKFINNLLISTYDNYLSLYVIPKCIQTLQS